MTTVKMITMVFAASDLMVNIAAESNEFLEALSYVAILIGCVKTH